MGNNSHTHCWERRTGEDGWIGSNARAFGDIFSKRRQLKFKKYVVLLMSPQKVIPSVYLASINSNIDFTYWPNDPFSTSLAPEATIYFFNFVCKKTFQYING